MMLEVERSSAGELTQRQAESGRPRKDGQTKRVNVSLCVFKFVGKRGSVIVAVS
jgi:hypothetical protein